MGGGGTGGGGDGCASLQHKYGGIKLAPLPPVNATLATAALVMGLYASGIVLQKLNSLSISMLAKWPAYFEVLLPKAVFPVLNKLVPSRKPLSCAAIALVVSHRLLHSACVMRGTIVHGVARIFIRLNGSARLGSKQSATTMSRRFGERVEHTQGMLVACPLQIVSTR